ncbi:PREDICTED: uncharacterized protein LOC106819524, partial [Priapulus caudatus]|uniref:Uncharacterized protein LOC106819524 n=1 Tax=Priapulus caudatus TaxID=37621 RepID=A0ABM1F5A9_PRICU
DNESTQLRVLRMRVDGRFSSRQMRTPRCNDPFSAQASTIAQRLLRACSKSRLQYNDGQIVVIRACHDKEFNDTREVCLQDSLDYNEAYSVESCTCFSDACNDAASLRQRAPLVFAAMLALGAASWRCL